jgi:hypothetical protein
MEQKFITPSEYQMPDKDSIIRLLKAEFTPLQIKEKFPQMNINTLRSWQRRYCTKTVETTISTVSKTISTYVQDDEIEMHSSAMRASDALEDTAQFAPSVQTEMHHSAMRASDALEDTAQFAPSVQTEMHHSAMRASDALEDTAQFAQAVQTEMHRSAMRASDALEDTASLAQAEIGGLKLSSNTLIPIALLCTIISAIKYFSIAEVEYVIAQISSVSGISITVFAIVVVIAPLVLLANAPLVQSDAILHTIKFVVISTIALQIFCCAVSVSQQIAMMQKMQLTLSSYTFFTPLSFSWSYATFRGSVDIALEFVLLELITIIKNRD